MRRSFVERERITPPEVYFNRRALLRGGVVAASAVAAGSIYRWLNGVELDELDQPPLAGLVKPDVYRASADEAPSPLATIANYNNFYEFSTSKTGVARAARDFDTRDWKVSVGGLCAKPRVFDLDALRAVSPPEERVYRMRCVEAWSVVVPWAGYSLAKLLALVEPTSAARYVAFETLHDPARMPGQRTNVLAWPYVEGLRLDEAMHPLTLLATGLYGRELPPQDGAPVRLVVPWKYGFKGIKSIVKITLVANRPPTTWREQAPDEYGFYANVNPRRDHPRWSQATENRLGEGRRPTLLFNGYADQVAALYAGMDLDVQF